MKKLIIIAALAACSAKAPQQNVRPLVGYPVTGWECVTPEQFGAVASDGVDDRAALQAAVNSAQAGGHCVLLGPGTYHVTRSQTEASALKVTGTVEIKGAGQDATTISMLGTGIKTGKTAPGDWWLVGVTAGNGAAIHDLALTGDNRTNTSEQTHLLQIVGPASNLTVERVRFHIASIGPNTGGDCVRLLGSAAQWAAGVTLRQIIGEVCDRSFVAVQRGVHGLRVLDSESREVGGQAIDFEPSGTSAFGCSPSIYDVRLNGLTLRRGASPDGAWTVAIAGDGCAVAQDITLSDSVIEDGSVFVYNTSDVTLLGLDLRNRLSEPEPTVRVSGRMSELRIVKTRIERPAGSIDAPVLQLTGNGEPADATLLRVTLVQHNDTVPLRAESIGTLTVMRSRIDYLGAGSDSCVLARGILAAAGGPVMVDDFVTGAGAVRMAGMFVEQPTLIRVVGP